MFFLLLCCCAQSVPIPLSAPRRLAKDRSLPFPCMDRPCGCASAEQCRKSCGCFTHAERSAWAFRTAGVQDDGSAGGSDGREQQERACCAANRTHKRVILGFLAQKCRGESTSRVVILPIGGLDRELAATLVEPPNCTNFLDWEPPQSSPQAAVEPRVPPPRITTTMS